MSIERASQRLVDFDSGVLIDDTTEGGLVGPIGPEVFGDFMEATPLIIMDLRE